MSGHITLRGIYISSVYCVVLVRVLAIIYSHGVMRLSKSVIRTPFACGLSMLGFFKIQFDAEASLLLYTVDDSRCISSVDITVRMFNLYACPYNSVCIPHVCMFVT